VFNFFNQIKPRIDYFLYYEGMYCMSYLVGRSSMTWFSSKIIIIIIPFIYGACWGCYLWICLYDTWCDVSLIVEAWRIWICDPWIFIPLLHIYIFFSRKRRRAVHHYIKKIKMGQEPIQNNTKPHTHYTATAHISWYPISPHDDFAGTLLSSSQVQRWWIAAESTMNA